jgi:hypothetical protein
MMDILKTLPTPGVRLLRGLEEISSWGVPMLLFAGALSVPLPSTLWDASRHGFWGFGIAIAILYYFAFRTNQRDRPLGRALSLSAILITFALPLARLWQTGATDSYVVGGLLPVTDAAGYYGDARSILLGNTVGDWSPQRPLFSGLLASLLTMTRQNFQASLALLVMMNGIACWFVAREVQKTHGALVAAVLSMQVFFYYRVFAGKAMTENLGMAVGLLGFALLWRSAHSRHLWTGLWGLFLLAFALNARIGTIFVLPAVILWGAYWFRRSHRFSTKFLLGGLGAVVLASALNLILLKQVGIPNGSPPFANFSYTLYGIVTHSSWTQAAIDHPQITKLDNAERIRAIADITFELIRQNPWRLLTGLLRGWRDFFWSNYSIYSWLQPATSPPDLVLRPLAVLGLWGCWRNWKTPGASLLLAMAIGAFLTIPLLPIVDTGIRAYAVTVVILYMLSALGFLLLFKDILRSFLAPFIKQGVSSKNDVLRQESQRLSDRLLPKDILCFGLLICSLSVVAPIILNQTANPPAIPATFTCPPGQEARRYQMNPGSSVNLVGNREIDASNLPNIRLRDFKKSIRRAEVFLSPVDRAALLKLEEITIANDGNGFLAIDPSLLPVRSGFVAVCGQTQTVSPDLKFFQATLLRPLSNAELSNAEVDVR